MRDWCEHAFDAMRSHGAEVVIGTGGDGFNALGQWMSGSGAL